MTQAESKIGLTEDTGRLGAKLFICLMFGALGAVFGELYSAVFYNPGADGFWQGARTGFCVGFFVSIFEVFYVGSVRRSWLRRLAFIPSLFARILIITLIVRVSLVGNHLLTDVLNGQSPAFETDFGDEMRDTLFSLAIVFFIVAQMQLSSIIGFKRFNNLLIGRYFRPVQEERIFLFVDLVGSSLAARQLGDVRFHEFLAEFFHHADRAVVRHGGEIVSYVGDAVIVTWPLVDNAKKNARCLKAVDMIRREMKRNTPFFENEFGRPPHFRAALHGGPVVVGECGDSRRQVTFLGDVVNMTARIEGACKNLNEPFLISDFLVERLTPPNGISFQSYGEVDLKDADKPFELHRISFTD